MSGKKEMKWEGKEINEGENGVKGWHYRADEMRIIVFLTMVSLSSQFARHNGAQGKLRWTSSWQHSGGKERTHAHGSQRHSPRPSLRKQR